MLFLSNFDVELHSIRDQKMQMIIKLLDIDIRCDKMQPFKITNEISRESYFMINLESQSIAAKHILFQENIHDQTILTLAL